MSPTEILKGAGIHTYMSAIGVPHFRTGPQHQHHVGNFIEFQNRVLQAGPALAGSALAHLIAFDGLNPLEAEDLIQSRPTCYQTARGSVLEFTRHDSAMRRFVISNMTQVALTNLPAQDETVLLEWIASLKIFTAAGGTVLLLELRQAQLAWLFERLPMALFGHVSELVACTHLDNQSWCREHSGLAPQVPPDASDALLCAGPGSLLDAAQSTQSKRNGVAFVRQAVQHLTLDAGTEQQHLRRWLLGLLALGPSLHSYSPQTALIVSWVADLIESGTVVAQSDASFKTRRRYATTTAAKLYQAISHLPAHPGSWTKSQRRATFSLVLEECQPSDRPIVRASLNSFQYFLLENFDLQPLRLSDGDPPPTTRVRAQWITETEATRMAQWLAGLAIQDEALKLRLQVAFWLCHSAPFRIAEVLGLRQANITPDPVGGYEITVLPTPGVDLKTDAAARRMWVRAPEACNALRELLNERGRELWTSTDLLFGKAQEGQRPYKYYTLRRVFLHLLKACTGDPSMTIHALRHAWACRSLDDVFSSTGMNSINRLTQIAAELGHASIQTTITRYYHTPERALRLHLDVALRAQSMWTSDIASVYCKISAPALRQRASREKNSIEETASTALRLRCERTPLPPPDVTSWTLPSPPTIGLQDAYRPTALGVLNFLIDASNGMDAAQIAPRQGITASAGLELWSNTCRLANELDAKALANPVVPGTSGPARGIWFAKAMQTKYKRALEWMEECTANDYSILSGVAAWRVLRNRYGFLNLEHSECYSFLALIKVMGFTADNFDIYTQKRIDSPPGLLESRIATVRQTFILALGATPAAIVPVEYHPTRPDMYLRWHAETAGSAGTDLRGLDAIMAAIFIAQNSNGVLS